MTGHQRVIASIAQRVGRPATIYVLLAVVAAWIAFNALATRLGWKAVDSPPFWWLQGAVTLYSAFMTTLIVVAQHRQRIEADQREHLELQVNLLAEQKTTKIISLLEELRRDLRDVRDRNDPVADALQQEIDPHAMHSALKR